MIHLQVIHAKKTPADPISSLYFFNAVCDSVIQPNLRYHITLPKRSASCIRDSPTERRILSTAESLMCLLDITAAKRSAAKACIDKGDETERRRP